MQNLTPPPKVFYSEAFVIENLEKLLRIFLHGSYGTVNAAPDTRRVSSYTAVPPQLRYLSSQPEMSDFTFASYVVIQMTTFHSDP